MMGVRFRRFVAFLLHLGAQDDYSLWALFSFDVTIS